MNLRTKRVRTRDEHYSVPFLREFGNQLFSRASGAPLRERNSLKILKDASENYGAWLDAIAAARESIHFEMYIFSADRQGRIFADALIEKARQGVRVQVLYDWLGALGSASSSFWNRLRQGGVEVRCYNPPHFDSPLGWLSRDHRKVIIVDRTIGFVTGLCIGQKWLGDAARGLEPWRDTGVEVRGPAVSDIIAGFAEAWQAAVNPLAVGTSSEEDRPIFQEEAALEQPAAGDIALRIVPTVPNTASLLRVDQLIASLARHTLWLTDAYYAGTTLYVEALRAAARDGVDVRLLVPGATDLPWLRPLSRSGYRPLLQAGVRVFEWNGSMLHAKTAVADARWGRVGSTNLNMASWMGNREMDVIVENENVAHEMEEMYLADLEHATEIVLTEHNRLQGPIANPRLGRVTLPGGRGSGGRAVSGAMRIGNTVAAAITNQRVLEPIEAHIALAAGAVLVVLCALAILFPRAFAYPFALVAIWLGTAFIVRGFALRRRRR